jgi:uncharacterized protein YdiU (UPF0061 family)
MVSLDSLPFHSRFADELPGDLSLDRGTRQVHKACYSLVAPEPVSAPKLIGWSDDMGKRFGLKRSGEDILAGNKILPGMKPFAACYGGHQFGNWASQLGDGRALVLGELKDQAGELWELQLKGAGKTPYSRHADGRAVLRSSLREFLASEAMFHLGVPTTRALSLMLTGDTVERDMFYDGHSRAEPGAITTRMAPTFVRFGNFEIQAARDDFEILKTLADWTIKHHFKEIDLSSPQPYQDWFTTVCESTAKLMVEWLRVGFVHGVMNTDNMSILGLTIDYGPYGFLDAYDPAWTPNTTDLPGRRYCYGQQAPIALWNLRCLAFSLKSLVKNPEDFQNGLDRYVKVYESEFKKMMAGKLGLRDLEDQDGLSLIQELNELLLLEDVDMTIFFRKLAHTRQAGDLTEAFYAAPGAATLNALTLWLQRLQAHIERDKRPPQERRFIMNKHNPRIIPRNYLLYKVIEDVEKGDLTSFENLYSALRQPYNDEPAFDSLSVKRPDWARQTPGSSTLSCSS